MNRRLFLGNLGTLGFIPLFLKLGLRNSGEGISHPWFIELECEKCGLAEYKRYRTQDGAGIAYGYEIEKGCIDCGGKRFLSIGEGEAKNEILL